MYWLRKRKAAETEPGPSKKQKEQAASSSSEMTVTVDLVDRSANQSEASRQLNDDLAQVSESRSAGQSKRLGEAGHDQIGLRTLWPPEPRDASNTTVEYVVRPSFSPDY